MRQQPLEKVSALGTILFLLSVLPAVAQTRGEVSGLVLFGADSRVKFTGFSAGGGVFFQRWFGLEAEFGIVVDDSDEQSAAPLYSGGVNLRVLPDARLTPFVAAGAGALGDTAGPYAGGGINYWFGERAALRLEVRAFVPTADNRPCRNSPRPPVCAEATTATFFRAGVSFRF